jgi:hypothetical protein
VARVRPSARLRNQKQGTGGTADQRVRMWTLGPIWLTVPTKNYQRANVLSTSTVHTRSGRAREDDPSSYATVVLFLGKIDYNTPPVATPPCTYDCRCDERLKPQDDVHTYFLNFLHRNSKFVLLKGTRISDHVLFTTPVPFGYRTRRPWERTKCPEKEG